MSASGTDCWVCSAVGARSLQAVNHCIAGKRSMLALRIDNIVEDTMAILGSLMVVGGEGNSQERVSFDRRLMEAQRYSPHVKMRNARHQ